MRRNIALAVVLLAAACGGSPSAPNTPARYVLAAGAFTLNLSPAPVTICMTIGPGAGMSMSIPVTLDRIGMAWVARPATGTLLITMTETSAGVEGALEGAYTLGGTTVTIAAPGTAATISASTLGAPYLAGPIQGDVRYTSAGAQSSCTANNWSLTPR